MRADFAARLAELERDLVQLPPQELLHLLGELEELKAAVWLKLTTAMNGQGQHAQTQPDELLDVEEAARRLGTSEDFLYRKKDLPFRVRVGGRRIRFSAQGIERYIRLRQGR